MIKVIELTDKYTICDYIDDKETTPMCQIKELLDIHEIIKKDGNYYSVCCRSEKQIAVQKLDKFEVEDIDETNEDEWTCPYCDHIDRDAFELGDDTEEHQCPNCGSTVNTHRIISWTYNVEPVMAVF